MTAAAVESVAQIASRRGHPDSNGIRQGPLTPLERIQSRILARADLPNLPQPEPLIENTLDRSTIALLAGPTGTCKSFIALDWACCIATGHAWQGRSVQPGKVLYVASEGAEGLDARVRSWEYAWRQHVVDLEVLPLPVQLADSEQRQALSELTAARRYALVILDTLARCAVGLEENSARDIGLIIDAADRIRRQVRSTVLLVHHTGKDGSTIRGSSALESGSDTVYTTAGDTRCLKLERTKRKDGPKDDVHLLALKPNDGGSCHIQATVQGTDQLNRSERLLSTFVSTFKTTGASKAELRNVAEMPNVTFARALNDLLADGSLTNSGTDKRPHYFLGTKA